MAHWASVVVAEEGLLPLAHLNLSLLVTLWLKLDFSATVVQQQIDYVERNVNGGLLERKSVKECLLGWSVGFVHQALTGLKIQFLATPSFDVLSVSFALLLQTAANRS